MKLTSLGIILGRKPSFDSIMTAATMGGDCNITGIKDG